MLKLLALTILANLGFALFAYADSASVQWPTRNSQVICGGIADKEDLAMSIVIENELLKAESKDGRMFILIDLHKPGQVRWEMADSMTDAEADQRDALLAKLSPEESALVRKFTASHITDLYSGLTDGYVHFTTSYGGRTLSLSCQERPLAQK